MIKFISTIFKNDAKKKKKKDAFLIMLLGTLSASLLRNLLTGKGVKTKIPGRRVVTADKVTIRIG